MAKTQIWQYSEQCCSLLPVKSGLDSRHGLLEFSDWLVAAEATSGSHNQRPKTGDARPLTLNIRTQFTNEFPSASGVKKAESDWRGVLWILEEECRGMLWIVEEDWCVLERIGVDCADCGADYGTDCGADWWKDREIDKKKSSTSNIADEVDTNRPGESRSCWELSRSTWASQGRLYSPCPLLKNCKSGFEWSGCCKHVCTPPTGWLSMRVIPFYGTENKTSWRLKYEIKNSSTACKTGFLWQPPFRELVIEAGFQLALFINTRYHEPDLPRNNVRRMYSNVRRMYGNVRRMYGNVRRMYSIVRRMYSNVRRVGWPTCSRGVVGLRHGPSAADLQFACRTEDLSASRSNFSSSTLTSTQQQQQQQQQSGKITVLQSYNDVLSTFFSCLDREGVRPFLPGGKIRQLHRSQYVLSAVHQETGRRTVSGEGRQERKLFQRVTGASCRRGSDEVRVSGRPTRASGNTPGLLPINSPTLARPTPSPPGWGVELGARVLTVRERRILQKKLRLLHSCADSLSNNGPSVAERLACSPPAKAIRVQSPAGSLPDFRKWVSCPDDAASRRVFSGISRFPRPFIPVLLHNQPQSLSLGSQDLAVERHPNLFSLHFTHQRRQGGQNLLPLLVGPSRRGVCTKGEPGGGGNKEKPLHPPSSRHHVIKSQHLAPRYKESGENYRTLPPTTAAVILAHTTMPRRTRYTYKVRKSYKETCIVAERDWAAMAGYWGHDYLPDCTHS
ncbi:hypothetical protein PR048_018468 [Dryococelus australis]|uniref:DDE Tnp4 domain-containing protein n=1 Tax=Dryococelus australis TaxID=614101 RepID=A0ABQ9HCL2_9NEOP|nr:hypothetical protein PR048_018468 [Dryococelus australis]